MFAGRGLTRTLDPLHPAGGELGAIMVLLPKRRLAIDCLPILGALPPRDGSEITMNQSASRDNLKQVLAGHRGQCVDYQRTSGLGNVRQPFTWLSDVNSEEANRDLAASLHKMKADGDHVRFEAWEMGPDGWQLILGGQVLVLYVEVDSRLAQVRTLLQWASGGEDGRAAQQ